MLPRLSLALATELHGYLEVDIIPAGFSLAEEADCHFLLELLLSGRPWFRNMIAEVAEVCWGTAHL